jgi:beta-lactamase class D
MPVTANNSNPRGRSVAALAAICLSGLLAACSLLPGKNKIDSDKLDAALNNRLGGASTCVVLTDVKSGAVAYQYGADDICMAQLPPCDTFDVPAALIGLDRGVITPRSVYKWDGSPQPVAAWQADADIAKAYHDGIRWWWEDLSQAIGHDGVADGLKRFDYGDKLADGPERSFWEGPRNGGALALSTRQQAAFFRRFYTGGLGVKPDTASFVQELLVDEVRDDSRRGKATISSAPGACSVDPAGARAVGWSAGRLTTRDHDLIFSASVVGENAPPGMLVEQKLKDAFADAGLWPAG